MVEVYVHPTEHRISVQEKRQAGGWITVFKKKSWLSTFHSLDTVGGREDQEEGRIMKREGKDVVDGGLNQTKV